MRDQWRSDDHYRDDRRHEGREKTDHRRRSSKSPRRAHIDLGVKIKGSATTVSDRQGTRGVGDQLREVRKRITRERSRSGQRSKGEGPIHHSRVLSTERYPKPLRRSKEVEPPSNRPRARSRSPREPVTRSRHERRRSPSPDQSYRIIRETSIGKDHRERRGDSTSRSRHPDRLTASSRYEPVSADLPTRDSYIPSTRRYRSRSPDIYGRTSDTRYLPHSRDRPEIARRDSPQYRRREASDKIRGEQYFPRPYHDRESPPRRASRERYRSPQKRSAAPPHNQSTRREKARRLSKSPIKSRRTTKPTRVDQTSNGTIQAKPTQSSHPRSPHRRRPSFDAVSQKTRDMNQAFPMQSGRVGDGHDPNRPRQQLDTRQTYAASPPFMTPNTPQHGSPHSASPYGHGRGAWPVPQQFQGQSG